MKKTVFYSMAFLLLLTFGSMQLNARPESSSSTEVSSSDHTSSETVSTLLDRLDEIKAMDKSLMSPSEKRELRKEVRTIKKELKELGAGGYIITVAATIIIVLLLIVLL
jgi:peptidoglycan hydrolase CwlO-like protein